MAIPKETVFQRQPSTIQQIFNFMTQKTPPGPTQWDEAGYPVGSAPARVRSLIPGILGEVAAAQLDPDPSPIPHALGDWLHGVVLAGAFGRFGKRLRPAKTYQQVQDLIDDIEESLAKKYSWADVDNAAWQIFPNGELVKDLEPPPTRLTPQEISNLKALYGERDVLGKISDAASLQAIMTRVPDGGPATKSDILSAMKTMQGNANVSQALHSQRNINTKKIAEELYSHLSHSLARRGELPEALAGNLEEALYEIKNWDTSPYGVSPKPLVEQIRDITQAIANPQGTAAKKLPELDDNYLKPLRNYSNTFFHETSLEDAFPFFDPNSYRDMSEDIWLSNVPHLALGQGGNKGVLIELTANDLQGQVSRSKPAWKMLWDQGEGEFIAKYNNMQQYKDATKSVTIKPNLKAQKWAVQRFKQTMKMLGWEEIKNPDGSITYKKP